MVCTEISMKSLTSTIQVNLFSEYTLGLVREHDNITMLRNHRVKFYISPELHSKVCTEFSMKSLTSTRQVDLF